MTSLFSPTGENAQNCENIKYYDNYVGVVNDMEYGIKPMSNNTTCWNCGSSISQMRKSCPVCREGQ